MKRTIFTLFALLLACGAWGDEVSQQRAQQIAAQFFKATPSKNNTHATYRMTWRGDNLASSIADPTGAPAYYLFERTGGGFILVAGDDVVEPVLAYSEEGLFSTENMPANLRGWLTGIKEGIAYLRSHPNEVPATEALKAAWNAVEVGGSLPQDEVKTVLYNTALWGQGSPYNKYCPNFNGQTVTGCTATSLAIICRYHQWPDAGTGTLPSYTYTGENSISRTVSGYALGHSYNYANMPLDMRSGYTTAQAEAVATLMHDCGVALQASYGVNGTGAALSIDVIASYFKYDRSGILYHRNAFTQADWIEMIYNNLHTYGPIWYAGFSSEGGHAFVVDGVDKSKRFHINWGWTGSSNGYYTFPNFGSYTQSNQMACGMKKAAGGTTPDYLRLYNYSSWGIPGMAYADSSIKVTANTSFTVNTCMNNAGESTNNYQVAVGRYDRDGNLVEIAGTYSISSMKSGYIYRPTFTCKVTGVQAGDVLRCLYRRTGTTAWYPVLYGDEGDVVGELPLDINQNIADITSVHYNSLTQAMTIKTKTNAKFTLTDSAGTNRSSAVNNKAGVLTIDVASLPAGVYKLTLTDASDSSNTATVELTF